MQRIATFVVCLLILALVGGPAARAQNDSYSGFDLDRLAKSLAKLTALRTQHGEDAGNEAFEGWLRAHGSSRSQYEAAYAAWWERFRADASGKLEARFHTLNATYVQEFHYSDVPDRSQEKRGGITLDQYAKIAVALTQQPGADLTQTLRKHGIQDAKQWQTINEAWVQAMREDTSFALTQQYAALYQKHAGPDFARQQEAKLADALAQHNQRPAPSPAPRQEPATVEQWLEQMNTASGSERWEAARWVAHHCELWAGPARKPANDPRARHCGTTTLRQTLLPVILEALDRYDDDSIHYATGLLGALEDLDLKTDSAKITVMRAQNRAKMRLETLESAFRPIQDKAVPERVTLRSKIDDYTGAIAELQRTLDRW